MLWMSGIGGEEVGGCGIDRIIGIFKIELGIKVD